MLFYNYNRVNEKFQIDTCSIIIVWNKWSSRTSSGGSVCSKNKDIGANNHYFIGGYYFQFLFIFPHAIIMSISTLG
jgi:hypothetical protein